MKKIIYLSSICLLSLAGCDSSTSNKDNMNNLSPNDREFMTQAAYGNLAETEAGKMAKSKAMNEDVKMFGKMMADDHSGAYDELKKIAKDMEVDIPNEPDQEHKTTKDRLDGLSNEAFDAAYIDVQVTDHEKTVALFESEVTNGSDQRLKDYASKYLPTIREHLEKARSLATRP